MARAAPYTPRWLSKLTIVVVPVTIAMPISVAAPMINRVATAERLDTRDGASATRCRGPH